MNIISRARMAWWLRGSGYSVDEYVDEITDSVRRLRDQAVWNDSEDSRRKSIIADKHLARQKEKRARAAKVGDDAADRRAQLRAARDAHRQRV